MLFHFYDILEQAKRIFGDRNQNSDCLCRGKAVGEESRMWWLTGKGHETSYGDGNVLFIDGYECTELSKLTELYT